MSKWADYGFPNIMLTPWTTICVGLTKALQERIFHKNEEALKLFQPLKHELDFNYTQISGYYYYQSYLGHYWATYNSSSDRYLNNSNKWKPDWNFMKIFDDILNKITPGYIFPDKSLNNLNDDLVIDDRFNGLNLKQYCDKLNIQTYVENYDNYAPLSFNKFSRQWALDRYIILNNLYLTIAAFDKDYMDKYYFQTTQDDFPKTSLRANIVRNQEQETLKGYPQTLQNYYGTDYNHEVRASVSMQWYDRDEEGNPIQKFALSYRKQYPYLRSPFLKFSEFSQKPTIHGYYRNDSWSFNDQRAANTFWQGKTDKKTYYHIGTFSFSKYNFRIRK